MIHPVRRRALFEAFRLARPGRCGPVRARAVTVEGLRPDDVLVAYALGRRTGNAVLRNRVRRRLRAAVRELHERGDDALAGGRAYLLGADAQVATAGYPELCRWVEVALSRAVRPT